MILLALIIVMIIPQEDHPFLWDEIRASMYTFRFLIMIMLMVAYTAFAIKIMSAYKVNYHFIFDLNPDYKITFMQLIRVSPFGHYTRIDIIFIIDNMGLLFPWTNFHNKALICIQPTSSILHTCRTYCFYRTMFCAISLFLYEGTAWSIGGSLAHSNFTFRIGSIQTFLPRWRNHELCFSFKGHWIYCLFLLFWWLD